MHRLCNMALGLALAACTLPVGLSAQTSDAPATPPAAAATEATAAPAPAPSPLAGITSVLGGVNLTGLADVYYGYNANHPAGGTVTEPFTPFNNNFGLNLIELQLDKPVDKTSPLGFRVALGFGDAMTAINSASQNNDGTNATAQYLKEGYLSYMAPIGKGLQVDFGKYVTGAGAEVIETNQNWNYSRSLLFYYAIPYYHFGARAKYTFSDKWSITGYAANGWNNIISSTSGKTGGFSLAWNATKKVTLTETYLGGPGGPGFAGNNGDWNNLSDTVLAYNPTAKLSLQANFDYDHQAKFIATGKAADYAGIAAYAKYAFSPKVNVAGRFEYFNDHDGLATNGIYAAIFPTVPALTAPIVHNHLNEFTGTVERRLAGHLLSRVEYRHDDSNQPFFNHGSSFVNGQTTVDAGLVFVLEPNDTK